MKLLRAHKLFILIMISFGVGLGGWFYFTRAHYTKSDPPPLEYFYKKYTDIKDQQACIDEYTKYYPLGDEVSGVSILPCPGFSNF